MEFVAENPHEFRKSFSDGRHRDLNDCFARKLVIRDF